VSWPRKPPPIPLFAGRNGRPPDQNRTRPVEVRWCKHHGDVEFGHYANGPGRYRWFCKSCLSEAVTRRHQKVKRLLVEEAGGACAVCGYARTVVNLHFHHVDPSTKEFAVNMGRGKSLASFRAEAAKCVLVCANCHGEIEAGLIPSPPPQAKWGQDWTPVAIVPASEVGGAAEVLQLSIDLDGEEERLRPERSSAG
jgi:hypothetical protein